MAQPNVKAALSYLDAHLPDFQEQLVKLSRVPGVSAEPARTRTSSARRRPRRK